MVCKQACIQVLNRSVSRYKVHTQTNIAVVSYRLIFPIFHEVYMGLCTLTWEQEEPAYPYYLAAWEFLVCLASVDKCNLIYITCYSWANYNLLYNYRDAQANQRVNQVNRKSLFHLYWKSTFLTAPASFTLSKHGKDYSQVSASLIPPQMRQEHIYEIAENIPQ